MITSLLLLCPLLVSPTGGTPTQVDTRPPPRVPVYNVSLLLIGRVVDDADPADEHKGWGLEFDGYSPADAVGWEFGITRTSDEASSGSVDLEATIEEIYTGPRKTWGDPGKIHPFLSGGLAYVAAEADVSGAGSDDDSSFGIYVRGGAYWTFGEHFNVGADARALVGTDIEFGDADYLQLGVILGYSF